MLADNLTLLKKENCLLKNEASRVAFEYNQLKAGCSDGDSG